MNLVMDGMGASGAEHYRPTHTITDGAMKLSIIVLPCTLV